MRLTYTTVRTPSSLNAQPLAGQAQALAAARH